MNVVYSISKVHAGEIPAWKRTTPFVIMDEEIVRPSRNGMGYPTGIADVLIVMSYYIDKILRTGSDAHFKFATEDDCWTYVKETLFSMVYTFNQPTRSSQSCFTNVSVYDDIFLESLCADYKFVENDEIFTVKKDIVKKVQSIYLDVMNEVLRRTPCTFPVTTACFAVDEENNILDKSFVSFIADKNEEFAFINIYSGKSSTLSSCCFGGKTEVIVSMNKDGSLPFRNTFEKLYSNMSYSVNDGTSIPENYRSEKSVFVNSDGKWKEAKLIITTPKNGFMIDVHLESYASFQCTSDHQCVVLDEFLAEEIDVPASALKIGDYVRMSHKTPPECILKYGYIVENCIIKNDHIYTKVDSIKYYSSKAPVFCFEMVDEKDQYFTLANGVYTHNCRLRSDSSNEYFNSFGAGSTKLGSLGVVSLNMPRLAYISKNEDDFFDILRNAVVDVAYINNAKRNIIKNRISLGAYSIYSYGFADIKRQYSTCGITGLNECCNEMGYDILTEPGQQFVLKCLDVINKTNDEMQKKYKSPHNTEQVPAESSAIKLATKDKYLGFCPKVELYSNQFIPLTTNADMLDRIRLQGLFDKHFSGGAICHLNLGEKITKETMADMILSCAKMGVIYWAVNYQLNKCVDGHMTVGTTDICSICGKEVEDKYTRVVG